MPNTFLILYVSIVLAVLNHPHAFKIRYGRERSRILKLKRRKGVFTERLDNLLKTRGIGLFPLFALPEEQEEQGVDLTQLGAPQKVKRYPKNPLVKSELERYDPQFGDIPPPRSVKTSASSSNRPGALEPRAYARHFIEVDPWDIHPSNLRVRGRYFNKLFQQELREPFKRHKNDTGSSEVQIASLTARIDYLRKHLDEHPKDIKARLNVVKLGNQRRRLLGYLYRTKPEACERLVNSFNINFDTSPYNYKKLIPKFSHMYHNNTKRYSNAKEAREARLRYLFNKLSKLAGERVPIDLMKSLTILLNALVFGALRCGGLKCARHYRTLCMQTPPISRPISTTKCLYALFPESKNSRHESLKESFVKIDGLNFQLDDNVLSHTKLVGHGSATSDNQNDATIIAGDGDTTGTFLKIGSNYALDGGANVDKRRSNHLALVELALVLLKCDALVLPVDAEQLFNEGCSNIYQLQLAKVALFLLKQCSAPLPRVHVVIYNWHPNREGSDDEFNARQKQEIHKVLLDHLDYKGGVSTTCSFSPDTTGPNYLSQLASVIKERLQYKQKIKDHLPLDHLNKRHALKELMSFYKWLQDASADHIGFGPLDEDLKEIQRHTQAQASIYYIQGECKKRLSQWFESLREKQMALGSNDLVAQIDLLCDDIMLQYDTQTKELAASSAYCKSAVANSRKVLLEFIGQTLGKILTSMAIQIHEETFQQFKEATSKLILNSQLAENLESLVQEYDEQFCRALDRCKFRLAKNDKMHNMRRESLRLEFLDECTQVANHVLEYAISKGYFYHKPNVLDGIRWLRRSKYLRWLYRIFKRIKIPISLSVHYLSRNAFGFSDKFSSRQNLGPKVLRYFT